MIYIKLEKSKVRKRKGKLTKVHTSKKAYTRKRNKVKLEDLIC